MLDQMAYNYDCSLLSYNIAYLCNAYVKDNEKTDFREMAKLKIKIQLINEGKFTRGRLL